MRKRAKKLAAKGPCRVYWGTHGCHKQRGHLGRHYCSPGCLPPTERSHVFGDDVDLYPGPAGDPKPQAA